MRAYIIRRRELTLLKAGSCGGETLKGSLYCFNLLASEEENPLQAVLKLSDNSTDWDGEYPDISHYMDGRTSGFKTCLYRLLDCKDNIGELFNMKLSEHLSTEN